MGYQETVQRREDVINVETGELIATVNAIETRTVSKAVREENFVKVYYDTYLAMIGANHADLSDFIICVAKRMTYSENNQVVTLLRFQKDEIARELKKSSSAIDKMIRKCVELNILKRAGGSRSGTYYVSPYIVAKGEWNNVQKFRLEYTSSTAKNDGWKLPEKEDQKMIESNDQSSIEEPEEIVE